MKVRWRHGTCGFGHPTKRPFTRSLEIHWGDKVLVFKVRVLPTNLFAMPLCGKCLGVE